MSEPSAMDRELAKLLGVDQDIELRTITAYLKVVCKDECERVLAEVERIAGEMCAPRHGGMSVNDSRPAPSFSYWVRELTCMVREKESGT